MTRKKYPAKYLTKTQSKEMMQMLNAIKAHDESNKGKSVEEIWAERIKENPPT